jgi:hypothetical protein
MSSGRLGMSFLFYSANINKCLDQAVKKITVSG